QNLATKLDLTEKQYANTVAKLKSDFAAQSANDKAAFDKEMKRLKLSAAERAGREAAYRANMAKKERELAQKIDGLKWQLAGTSKELAKARAEVEARKNVAREIQKGFAKAGIKADVDEQTGDVTLDF